MSRAVASRYQPALVALHWLVALLIVGLLCLGFFVLDDMPNSDPKKLQILVWHMSGGIFVLLLMIVRIIVRIRSAKPVPAHIGSPALDRLATLGHYSLYAIVFLMIATGWTTGFLISGAFAPGGKLPVSFDLLPSFRMHEILATVLVVLIAGHVLAALYHQFVLKDGLFRRMWFGKRTLAAAEK